MNTLSTIKGNSFFISHKQHAHQNESTIIWREKKIEIQGLILFCLLALVLRRNVSKSANDLLVWVINNQQNNKCPAMAQLLRSGYPSPVRNLINNFTLASM